MYYQPERIPEAYRQPYKRSGLVCGRSELSDDSPMNRDLANALREGGPRNGVLTAIEDFLRQSSGRYYFRCIELEYGLGMMLKPRHLWDVLRSVISRWRGIAGLVAGRARRLGAAGAGDGVSGQSGRPGVGDASKSITA
jgi:hypothetical protein